MLVKRFSKAGPNADVGKLRIRRVPGMRADVTFTLSDGICAPIVGISEEVGSAEIVMKYGRIKGEV